MIHRFPIEFVIHPPKVDKGTHWVTLELKNVGTEILNGLDIKLNFLNTYSISVFELENILRT